MKTKLYTFLLSSLLCTGALADNEPWQNPQVNEINREPCTPTSPRLRMKPTH